MVIGVITHAEAWAIALMAFDLGDPEPLAGMVARAEQPIPPGMRRVLGDIVAGRRTPKKKARAKLALAPKRAAELGQFESTRRKHWAEDIGSTPCRITTDEPEPWPRPLHWPPLAEFDDLEHAERRREQRATRDATTEGIAKVWDIAPKTLCDLRKRFTKTLREVEGRPERD